MQTILAIDSINAANENNNNNNNLNNNDNNNVNNNAREFEQCRENGGFSGAISSFVRRVKVKLKKLL